MRRAGLLDSLFDSKLALGIAGTAAMAIGVLAVVWWQRPADVPAPAAAPAPNWDAPAGPGQLLARDVRSLRSFDLQVPRDARIAVDAGGHLVPDRALRTLMDSFLVKTKPEDRQAMAVQLREFLAGRLRQPAAGEADRLATAYEAYLQAQAGVRLRLPQPTPDGLSEQQVKDLLAWQRDRASLRERMLGADVANAWFAEEDGNCAAVLDEWEKQLAPPDDNDSVEQMNRRRWGDTLAQRRNENAQACAAQIADSTAAPRS